MFICVFLCVCACLCAYIAICPFVCIFECVLIYCIVPGNYPPPDFDSFVYFFEVLRVTAHHAKFLHR